MEKFKVFFLKGGSTNFVCESITGVFDFKAASEKVAELQRMGYIAEAKKHGEFGGLLSYFDFESIGDAQEYYYYLKN